MRKRLFFSVGEPSGDQHAAGLIRHWRSTGTPIDVRGFGGPHMAAAGAALDLTLTDHAVVGILEVLPKIREFFRFVDQAEAIFARGEVDGVVLVDFPGFNWHIAKRAKKYGLPVTYYCPPQLWAWGGWRIGKLRRTVDEVLCVLPMEVDYYTRHGVPHTFVGHPFFDHVAESRLDAELVDRLRTEGRPTVAVLPGSRSGEVAKNWPVMRAAMERLSRDTPSPRFVVACAKEKHRRRCEADGPIRNAPGNTVDVVFTTGHASEAIEAADAAMMVSGSVSLEMMARRTPAAVLYRVSRSLNFIARRLVHLDSITLPNLIAGRRIYPEMVSTGDPGPAVDFLVDSIRSMIGDPFYAAGIRRDLDRLCDDHARPGATVNAADRLAATIGASEARSIFDGTERSGSQTERPLAA